MFYHYSELPLSVRTLFTATLVVLGIGYLFAMIQIYAVDAGRDGRPGLSPEDIAISYSGNRTATRLESALSGPMSGMLPADELATIIGWVHRGLDKAEYDARIKPIIEQRCLTCHDGSNPHIPNLNGFENVSKVAQIDTGMSLTTLVRVSHIHIFGMTFIFFIMGTIFSHAYVRPVWFKSTVIVVPYLAMAIDVGSWYLTKINTAFAWAVIIGGGLMGFSFAVQWIVSMYQIWLYKYAAADHPKATVG
ncbi:MAG: hypothetical protein NUV72_10145 [Bauldia sp.]|nr:hypothetical protein [Bauldia sp.]